MAEKLVESKNSGKLTTTTYEFPYMRKPPAKKTLGQIIYDNEKGKVLGRTPKSWLQIVAFYIVFYIVLAALFAICMQALLATLDGERPKWQLDASLIGTNPGVGFRPISDDVTEASLIWYNAANKTEVTKWVDLINRFLDPYFNPKSLPGGGKNQVICDYDKPPALGNVCAIDITNWGPCTDKEGYGYNRSKPCVFLKVNRIFGWVPEYYDDVDNLPAEMPADLVDHIKSLKVAERKQVWVSCKGENAADVEVVGPLQYIPQRGIPSYFYPFQNIPGYLSPLIAVRFENPGLHRIINVECRIWAKNVIYQGGRDRRGSVHFELMID